jgi:hypothetical protein
VSGKPNASQKQPIAIAKIRLCLTKSPIIRSGEVSFAQRELRIARKGKSIFSDTAAFMFVPVDAKRAIRDESARNLSLALTYCSLLDWNWIHNDKTVKSLSNYYLLLGSRLGM